MQNQQGSRSITFALIEAADRPSFTLDDSVRLSYPSISRVIHADSAAVKIRIAEGAADIRAGAGSPSSGPSDRCRAALFRSACASA